MNRIRDVKRLLKVKGRRGPGRASFELGRKARDLLLAGRSEVDLTRKEISLLIRAYNWSGEHPAGYALAFKAVQRWGSGFFRDLLIAHHNAFHADKKRFLEELDRLIALGIGKAGYWRLIKVDYLIEEATGEDHKDFDWQLGDPIVDIAALTAAAHELSVAINEGALCDAELRRGWNERFACVVSMPEYSNLRRVSRKRFW